MSSFDTYVDGADIQEDQLGMSKRYQGIAKFVRTCNTPMTVSIQGDWGTGKTAAMNFILRELMENAKGNQRKPVDEDKLIYPYCSGNTRTFSI